MKLQGLGIIFAIIILPIAVILSYFIQMQVDTINLRTSYDTKVLDATHDAVAALELNTANEKLSDVSDSLRSILEASNNVFFNTLLTNFGLSNASPSLFQPYVPSILYTLYDGYYIYSPTRSPDVLKYGDYETMTLSSGVKISAGSIVYGDGSSPSVIPRPDFDSGNTDPQNTALVNINGQAVVDIKGQMYYKYKGNTTPGSSEYIVTNTGDYFVADITQADLKNDYLLKSYMPYAARYKWSGGDIVINYTLDNYMNIEGTVGDVYYTKTGYLIDPDSVEIDTSSPIKEIVFESEEPDGTRHYSYQDANIELLKYNEQDLEELIASGRYSNININIKVPDRDEEGSIKTDAAGSVIYITNQVALKLEYAPEESLASIEESLRFDETRYQEANAIWRNANYSLTALYDPTGEYNSSNAKPAKEWMNIYINQIKEKKSRIQIIKAIQYYLRNKVFSKWVYDNLNEIEEKDTEQILSRDTITQMQSDEEKAGIDLFRDFSDSHVKIFAQKDQDVELNSPFINHKLSIMRNSIQYNLNLAFSTYTKKTKTYIYELPIMSDSEWDKIMSRVSMVAYFEGMPCGSKTYSNYSVVSSTNNEITVIPDELYYVPTISFSDGKTEAHRIDCDKLVNETFIDGEDVATTYDANRSYLIAFRSKELKYDRVYNKNTDQAEYDYMNLMCYDCIVNNNMRFDHIKRPTNSEKHFGLDSAIDFKYLSERLESGSNKEKILYREYLIAVASQRQGLYKTNAMTRSEGYTTDSSTGNLDYGLTSTVVPKNVSLASGKTAKDIKGLEIVISNLKSSDINEVSVQFTVFMNDIEIGQDVLNASKYTKNQTLRVNVDPNLFNGGGCQLKLVRNPRNSVVTGKIVGVRVIYK